MFLKGLQYRKRFPNDNNIVHGECFTEWTFWAMPHRAYLLNWQPDAECSENGSMAVCESRVVIGARPRWRVLKCRSMTYCPLRSSLSKNGARRLRNRAFQ